MDGKVAYCESRWSTAGWQKLKPNDQVDGGDNDGAGVALIFCECFARRSPIIWDLFGDVLVNVVIFSVTIVNRQMNLDGILT